MANDQQTVTAYKGSDLQLGMISAGATPTVTMTHKMGLVRLNPTTKSVANKLTYTYNQANGSYTSSTSGSATITASNDFTGNKPYTVSSQYWHIVKATAAATNTAMSFTCNANQKDYWSAKSSGTDVGYGKYKVIDIQSDRTAANFEALFSYVGTCQTVTLPWYDNYVMQCWGAQGGDIADGAAYPYGGLGDIHGGHWLFPKIEVFMCMWEEKATELPWKDPLTEADNPPRLMADALLVAVRQTLGSLEVATIGPILPVY